MTNTGFVGIVIEDKFYFLQTFTASYYMYWYDKSDEVLSKSTSSLSGVTYSQPTDRNLLGMSYDGSDLIYFIMIKNADSKNYLVVYSIIADTFTISSEMNISIMADRNCNTSGDEIIECFQYEKAFGITVGTNSMYIYRIPRVYSGNLWLIASLKDSKDSGGNTHGASSKILAVTDHYLIVDRDGDGDPIQVWEYIDVMSTLIPYYEIIHKTLTLSDYYPSCKLTWIRKIGYQDPPIPDQIIQIYGRYSNVLLSGDVFYGPSGDDDFNDEVVGTSGTDIDWVDSATLPNACTCTIEESLDGHKNVLKLTHDGGAGDPSISHNITAATTLTYEWYWATSDITRTQYIRFLSDATEAVILYIASNKYNYYDDVNPTVIVGDVPVNNIFDLFKIVINCTTDKIDIYINGTLRVNQGNFRTAVASINKTNMQNSTNAAYSQYIDAPGLVGATYYAGQNKNKYLDDAVIFEGMVRERNRNIEREISIESLAKEDLENAPVITDYTDYTGKTTGPLITQLLTDFAKYITAGTISNGSNTFVCPDDWSVNGDKSLLTIILELTDGELFLARTRPKGELDVDNGATVSNLTLTDDVANWDHLLREFSQRINQVILYGGFVNGEPVGPAEANNTAHQQQSGQIIKWSKTYASITDLTLLGTFATNKLALQGSAPLIYWVSRKVSDFGFIQTGLTIAIPASEMRVQEGSDEYVPADAYILYDNIYEGKNQSSDFKFVDGLYFFEDASETLGEQNSQLIEQLAGEIADIIAGTEDLDAIHVNVAEEIHAIAEKGVLIGADELVIEDSADSWNKKRITIENLFDALLGLDALTDPAADKILFWDDSETALKWLVPNTGLAISGTNLNCSITQYTDALAVAAVAAADDYIKNDAADTLGGDLSLGAYEIVLDSTPDSDHTASGMKASFTAGENLVFGEVCYMKSDGKMWKARANASTTVPAIGMALASITAEASGEFLLYGIVRDDTWNWTVGGIIYTSDGTAGALTQTRPADAGDQVQVMGVATHADRMLLMPNLELVEI